MSLSRTLKRDLDKLEGHLQNDDKAKIQESLATVFSDMQKCMKSDISDDKQAAYNAARTLSEVPDELDCMNWREVVTKGYMKQQNNAQNLASINEAIKTCDPKILKEEAADRQEQSTTPRGKIISDPKPLPGAHKPATMPEPAQPASPHHTKTVRH